MTLITVALLAAFIGLGHWQWQRGVSRQALWSEYEKNTTAVHAPYSELDRIDRFTHVGLEGQFEPEHQFLLDNRSHDGQPGYEVLTPFRLSNGGRVLVNRGWIAFTGYRDRLPDVSLQAGAEPTSVTGRIEELPAAGLASGRAPPATADAWPKLTSFPTHEELEAALGQKLSRRILLLDPGAPGGYVRAWTPPGLEPSRHFSYAIQWWGFAVVLLVLYFGLNFRKVK